MSMSRKHEVISQALPIAEFEPSTSTSQTLKSEPTTSKPTTHGDNILCILILVRMCCIVYITWGANELYYVLYYFK